LSPTFVNLHKISDTPAGDDMKNLLDSVDLAIVFLDPELCVRRFTPSAVSIIKLIPADVGRPITDLVTVLDYPDLAADARAVLGTLVPLEKQVHATDGRWFSLRIMPYRTTQDRVDGTVITLSDITVTKNLESVLRRTPRDVDLVSTRGETDGA
jgi:two-component system, chemotaxis family, CheB/CheR fusion protein